MEEGKKIVDTPVNADLEHAISSNWAYDHAADFGLHTKVARKTAAQTLNNQPTLQNCTGLVIAIGANEVWEVTAHILFNAAATPDIKFGWALPSGATMQWGASGADVGSSATGASTLTNTTSNGTDNMQTLHCIIINGATAGNIQFQFCQATSDAGDTTVKANSCLIATKLA